MINEGYIRRLGVLHALVESHRGTHFGAVSRGQAQLLHGTECIGFLRLSEWDEWHPWSVSRPGCRDSDVPHESLIGALADYQLLRGADAEEASTLAANMLAAVL